MLLCAKVTIITNSTKKTPPVSSITHSPPPLSILYIFYSLISNTSHKHTLVTQFFKIKTVHRPRQHPPGQITDRPRLHESGSPNYSCTVVVFSIFYSSKKYIRLDPIVASKIVALRPALESLVVRAAKDPDQILSDMTPVDRKVVQTIRRLCELHAGSYEIQRSTQSAASSGECFPRQGHTLGAAGFGGPRIRAD